MNGRALLGVLLVVAAMPAWAGGPRDPGDVADAFAGALARGDGEAAKALLDPQVLIYESGGQEGSRAEYAAHHLPADMAFLAGAEVEVLDRRQGASGDLAWVATRSRISATHEGKPVDLFSTESLVLRRVAGDWKIVHIQWSSKPATKAGG